MSEITAIVARSYSYGMAWLRTNHKRLGLDPQQCRIITKGDALRGFKNLRIIYVRGWRGAHDARRIEEVILDCKLSGNVAEELFE